MFGSGLAGQENRQQRAERGQVGAVRHLHFQHHDGDDDGEHAVAEGFEPGLLHGSKISKGLWRREILFQNV